MSCTDMRAVEVIARLEDELSKPVLSSNQAMVFAALKALGIDPAEVGCGTLMSKDAPASRDEQAPGRQKLPGTE